MFDFCLHARRCITHQLGLNTWYKWSDTGTSVKKHAEFLVKYEREKNEEEGLSNCPFLVKSKPRTNFTVMVRCLQISIFGAYPHKFASLWSSDINHDGEHWIHWTELVTSARALILQCSSYLQHDRIVSVLDPRTPLRWQDQNRSSGARPMTAWHVAM